jgi:hypothetical protein
MAIHRSADADELTLTFVLPHEELDATTSVVGSFNDWTPGAHPFEADPDGTSSVTVVVPSGVHVYFRYLGPNGLWFDDPDADEITSEGSILWAQVVEVTPEDVAEPETEHVAEPVEAEDVAEPVETEDVAEPVETEDVAEPVETEDAAEPVETEDAAEPVKSEDAVETDDAVAPVETDNAVQPVESEAEAEPVEAESAAEPVETEDTVEPVDTAALDERLKQVDEHIAASENKVRELVADGVLEGDTLSDTPDEEPPVTED